MKKIVSGARTLPKYDLDRLPVLDSSQLMKRCEDSIEQASQLINEFVECTNSDLTEMDRALTYGDVARVASMAYRICNTASELGAQQTCAISKQLETSCRKGQYETLPLHVAQFRHTQASLRQAVKQFNKNR